MPRISTNDVYAREVAWDLYCHVEELSLLMKSAGNIPLAIASAFDVALAIGEDEGDLPDRAKCASALGLFYSQSEAELRRVLNGWRPASRRDSSREIREMIDSNELNARVVKLYFDENRVKAYPEFAFVPGGDKVVISIREGTTQQEAIRMLAGALMMVRNQWQDMIDMTPPDYEGDRQLSLAKVILEDAEKSRTLKSLTTPMLAGKGRKAMAPTAA